MIGQSEKSGIEIKSEYQLTGHPVVDSRYFSLFSVFTVPLGGLFWQLNRKPTASFGTIEFEKVFSIYGSEMTSIADMLESNRNSGRIPLLCFSVRNS